MFTDYLKLAFNNLRKRRLRSWLTMIGIFIGVAAVVSLISLGQGMEKAITEQFFQLGADKIQVVVKGPTTGPPGSNSDIILDENDLRVIQNARGVEVAAGRLIEPIRVSFNDEERFLFLATIPEEREERELIAEISNVRDRDFVYGRGLDPDDTFRVVMSEDYYDDPKFNGKALRVGDKVTINGRVVDIVGFFEKTGNPFVDLSFVMNEETARDLLDIPEKFGVIAVKVSTPEDIPLIARTIEKDLRNHRDLDEGEEDFEVNTAEDVLGTLTTVLGIVTSVLIGIAGISLLVGGIGITNTMYTAVIERTREIGIMKAIGATRKDILSVFMIESGLLGLVGGIIGVVIGIVLSKLVEYAAIVALGTSLIQASFPWYLILGSLAFSFIIGAVAGTFPAIQASKMQPVEALRG